MSFIDVNDIKGSPFPPENPKDGDLWLNTSVMPPRLMVWNAKLGEWVEIDVAGNEKRNLIRNSNFYASNIKHWNIINNATVNIIKMSGKKWARIKSNSSVNAEVGIKQTISAKASSKYAFQALSEIYIQSAHPNGNLLAVFYSIDENNNKTLIKESLFDVKEDPKVFTTTFTSLNNTKKIEVIISGEKNVLFDIVVTNIKLEANEIPTEYEIALEDIEDALNNKVGNTPEEVFDSLTDGGRVQGIYVDTDEEGIKNYYFNASYIKTGYLKGERIDAKNLTVTREDGRTTFNIDKFGNIAIRASQLEIVVGDIFEPVATETDIAWKIDIISTNGLIFKNGIVDTILKAIVYKGKTEVTNSIEASRFKWIRTSTNKLFDTRWNEQDGIGVKEIHITADDIHQRATFTCEITD